MTQTGYSPRRPHRETFPPHRFIREAMAALLGWDDVPRAQRNQYIMNLALQAPNEELAAWVRSHVDARLTLVPDA